VVVRDFRGIHHFDGFVDPRIERLPHRKYRLNSDLLQRILKLPVDVFDAVAEVGRVATSLSARSKLSSVGSRPLMTSAAAYSRKSCCSRTAACGHCRFRLQTRQPVKQRVALALSLSVSEAVAAAAPASAALPLSCQTRIRPRRPQP